MAKTATKAAAKPAPAKTATTAAKPATQAKTASSAPSNVPARTVPAQPKRPPPPTVVDERTVANLPAHMRGDVDMGKENIGQSDLEIPRLKLIQGLSKELQLYDDLKAGNFFHTASETIFDEPFRVVPIFFDRRYILWRPLENGGGILARADDGINWSPAGTEFEVTLDRKDGGHKVKWRTAKTVAESGLANWGTMNPADPNSPPAATLMYNFLLAFPDQPDLLPAVLTFQRSSIKMGRKFMTKLKTVRQPLFGSVFELSATDDHNSANQGYKNINIVGAGLVEDPDLYQLYKDMHLSFKGSGFNIRDLDTMQDDADGNNNGGEQPEGSPAY